MKFWFLRYSVTAEQWNSLLSHIHKRVWWPASHRLVESRQLHHSFGPSVHFLYSYISLHYRGAAECKDFVHTTGFPTFRGAIDCTHVGSLYKQVCAYHQGELSLNLYATHCNARITILNTFAKWLGSTHDSLIVD